MPSSLGPRSPRNLLGFEEKFSGTLDLQTKAIRYLENSVDTHKSTNHNIPEYRSLNLKPHTIVFEDISDTCDTVSDYKIPRIALSMKLTWNELT
jgi:hypothetical protein